jgi:hypothetical protein
MQEDMKETVHKFVRQMYIMQRCGSHRSSLQSVVLTNILDSELSCRMTLTKLRNLSAKVSARDLESILRQVWVNELSVCYFRTVLQ